MGTPVNCWVHMNWAGYPGEGGLGRQLRTEKLARGALRQGSRGAPSWVRKGLRRENLEDLPGPEAPLGLSDGWDFVSQSSFRDDLNQINCIGTIRAGSTKIWVVLLDSHQ
jgi:hypothetical protein